MQHAALISVACSDCNNHCSHGSNIGRSSG